MSHVRKSIKDYIPHCENVKYYVKAIEEQFASSEKALASTLLNKLSGVKINAPKSVREHIMEMRDISAQLKSLTLRCQNLFLFISFLILSL